MNLLISEILDLVDKAKTKEEKIKLLKQHETPCLRGLMKINFNTDVSMGLPEGEPPYKKEERPIGYQENTLFLEYRRFYIWLDPKTNLPKIKKEQLFIEMLEGLHHSEAEIMVLIKDHKLQKKFKNIKEDLIREVWPFLLPPKEEKKKVPLDS